MARTEAVAFPTNLARSLTDTPLSLKRNWRPAEFSSVSLLGRPGVGKLS